MADVFKDVSENISKALKTAQAKSQTFVDSVKIKKKISDLESKLNLILLELGRMFYIALKKDDFAEEKMVDLKSKANEARGVEEKIAVLKKELEDLDLKEKEQIYGKKVIGRCPKCGGPIYAGDKFCGSCGERVKIENFKTESDKMICPNCGSEIPLGSKFCPNCGYNLETKESK